MSEGKIIRPEEFNQAEARYDHLRAKLIGYQVEEEMGHGQAETHHFADGMLIEEITTSDLDMFDRVIHFPEHGDIGLEEFVEAKKLADSAKVMSRSTLWAFLANKMIGVIRHNFEKEEGLEENPEDK